MGDFVVIVAKSINSDHAMNNVVYYKTLPTKIDVKNGCFLYFQKKMILKEAIQTSLPGMKDGYIYLNRYDRMALDVGFEEKVTVSVASKPERAQSIVVSITDATKRNQIKQVTENIEMTMKSILRDTIVNVDTFNAFSCPDIKYAHIISIFNDLNNDIKCGYVDSNTEIIILNTEKSNFKLELSSINFEKVGVGGLEKEFTELMKSIFVTRIIPEKVFKKLNIKHMKGAILYGPPGCGKTRIARQIGSLIGCKNIKIINGPELLNKYIGESEKNIRDCFEAAKNKPEELHMLIFDEFDSIATSRGGSSTENNHNDKVVGQLLTMLDGVEEINNIIVFALTNRLDIIDPAILRPGRFGVHIKIDLPDLRGRCEILKIHSKDLINNKLFEPGFDLMKIAELTDNYTGAELESLVQTTVQNVLGAQIDFNNIVESAKKIENVIITHSDFLASISKINPMFKNKNKIKSELKNKVKKELDKKDLEIKNNIIEYINSKSYPVVCCIEGLPKSGKTSIVAEIGLVIGVDNVEYISAAVMVNMNERSKIEYLTEVFNRKIKTLIILDNIEMIIEFISEQFFNRNITNIIKILLGETSNNVIITTSHYSRLRRMTILDSVQYSQSITEFDLEI